MNQKMNKPKFRRKMVHNQENKKRRQGTMTQTTQYAGINWPQEKVTPA